MSPDLAWLIIGSLVLITETLFINSIFLLFIAIGAIVTGILMNFGYIGFENYILQFSVLFLITSFAALLLWKPLKNKKITNNYINLVGSKAVIIEQPLTKEKNGKVKWSGTIMNVRISSDSSVDKYEIGQEVEILAVEGTTLIVK